LIEKENLIIAGLAGKKAGLEVRLVNKDIIDSKNLKENKLKILALHTTITETIREIKPNEAEFIDSIDSSKLPDGFDYYAFGHIHAPFEKRLDNKLIVYPGPLFPNNFSEMEELKCGSFCMVSADSAGASDKKISIEKKKIELDIEALKIDASGKEPNQLTKEITDKIRNLKDKIITLRISGKLDGSTSDIPFVKINEEAERNRCILLKNTSALENPEFNTEIEIKAKDIEDIEREVIKKISDENPSEFNRLIPIMMKMLNIEKLEGETSLTFEKRLTQDIEKIIGIK